MSKIRFRCNTCKHYGKGETDKDYHFCKAFPNGLPLDIYVDRVLHYNKIDGQTGKYVYQKSNENKEFEEQIRAKISRLSIHRKQYEKEIILLLNEIIEEENIEKGELKLVAYWLQYEDPYYFFLRSYRKLKIYIVLESNEVKEAEVSITSEFVKKSFDLLWLENVQNQNTSMHIHLKEEEDCNFYFSIENSHPIIKARIQNKRNNHTFLWSKKDYDNVKKGTLYENCNLIEESSILELIKGMTNKENGQTLDTYGIFLNLYIRNILITPTEVWNLQMKLSKEK